jgi:hypothetical protein
MPRRPIRTPEYKKSEGDKAQLCLMGHALIENRHGLVVDVEVTLAA